MTKTQRKKAVQIAEDVLAQLKSRKYVAETGVYAAINGAVEEVPSDNWSGYETVPVVKSLRTFLKKHAKKQSCHVCALGACFLANVERRNKVETSDEYVRYEIAENLSSIFSPDQMDEIESAFEVSAHHGGSLAAVVFGRRYDTDDKRLRAIMRNIIKNNGEFIPTAVKEK